MGVTLRAKRSFPYAGRTITVGQTFDAYSEHDAMMLQRVGHAVPVPLEAETAAIVDEFHVHKTPAVWQALDTGTGRPDLSEDVKPKRSYRRRPVDPLP